MHVLLSAGNITTEWEQKKGNSNLCPINNLFNYVDQLKIHCLDEER